MFNHSEVTQWAALEDMIKLKKLLSLKLYTVMCHSKPQVQGN